MHSHLHPTIDRDKFKDVVHYICANCSVEELGNVKLHKALYFADMMTFISSGRPMTGVEYQKQKFGPVARHLTWAINELCKDGRLRAEKRDYFGFTKVDYVSLQHPSTRSLSNEEIHLLNEVIDFVCNKTAKELSELTHDAAWRAAKMGEVIPYYAAHGILPAAVSDADMDAAIKEAKRIRAAIDNGDRATC